MRILPILLFLFSFLINYAQRSEFSLIYELSNEAYEEKVLAKRFELTPKDCQVLVGSTDTLNWEYQPAGYYIEAKVVGEHLELSILDRTSIHVLLLNNERDFALQVLDSLGQLVNPEGVWLNDKEVKYDKKTETYRLTKHKKGGLVKVKTKEQILFYEVKEEALHNYRTRFRDRRFLYVLKAPLRAGKSIYQYFKRGIYKKNWRVYNPNKIVPFWKHFNKVRGVKGYIATNQPIYQHGDTLKIKAYAAEENGKPWDDKLNLEVSGYRFRKTIQLDPDDNGTITYEMRLDDSLKIDYNYSIRVSGYKNRYYGGLSHTFRIEDYQLDEVQYKFDSEQEYYHQGEKIILLGEGKDKNGLTITDGSVHIVAKRGRIHNIVDSMLYVPDTLWSIKEQLRTRGASQWIFPDSLLPKASLNIDIHATFTNSNGELHEKKKTIRYKYEKDRYQLKVENGQLFATHLRNEQSISDSIFFIKYIANEKIKKQIKLPYQEPLNFSVSKFYLEDEEENILERLENIDSDVLVQGTYHQNDIKIDILNPHSIPLNYWISKGEKIIASGQIDSSYFDWTRADKSDETYYIRFQYPWQGNSVNNTKTIKHIKNKLHITVEEPAKIIPGEAAQIKIKVRDADDKKVTNTNLVAGAINAQFNSKGNISKLKIQYKKAKALKKHGHFDDHMVLALRSTKRNVLTDEWSAKFQLDTQLFYRLRFPQQAVLQEYISFQQDSFYQNIAQFAPYIIKDGKSEPIFMIYCNRNLVYYYETDNNTPYSFTGRKGFNNIIVRTRNYEYEIDSVLLKKGHKLEFSINTKLWEQHRKIERRMRPDTLTQQEKELLNRQIFMLRSPSRSFEYFIWQDSFSIHTYNYKDYKNRRSPEFLYVGPFSDYKNIKLIKANIMGTRFRFEPGYAYDILPRRERLYKSDYFEKTISLRYHIPFKTPKDSINKPSDIRYDDPIFIDKKLISGQYQGRGKGKNSGSLKLFFENPKAELLSISLNFDSLYFIEHYRPSITNFTNLPVGSYTLYLSNKQKELASYSLNIKQDSLLIFKIDQIDWKRDTANLFDEWFNPPASKKKKIEAGISNLDNQNLPIYTQNGYEIQGKISDHSTKEPLIYASVLLLDNKMPISGATTDLDGYYSLIVPFTLDNPRLTITYIGYLPKNIAIDYQGLINVTLTESVNLQGIEVIGYSRRKRSKKVGNLSAIEITGYRVPLVEHDNTTQGQIITSEEIRNLPTRNINTISSTTAGLNVADEGEAINIRGSRNNTTDYYVDGIRVKGGLIPASEINFAASSIRSNFQDYAYWNPNLMTDQNGEAYFTVTYPDNITSWNTFVVGMDRKLRAGVAYGNTRSYKPLLAQLATPRFLVEGDESDLIGKAVNYTNDTLSIETKFEVEGEEIQNNSTDLVDGFVEKIRVNTPLQKDSLHFQYQLEMGDYFDGEKRSIPIVRKGVEAVEGAFYVLDQDTSLIFEPMRQAGKVEVFAEGNLMNSVLRSVEYLDAYPYGCNEQTASRLLALLMKKKVYAKLEKPFEQEKKIKKMVERLEKAQNDNGSWGWWRGNTANSRMSIYVTKVLQIAADEEYPTKALKKGLDYIALNIKKYDRRSKLDALLMLAQSNVPYNFEDELIEYDSTKLNLYERLTTIRIRQILNQEYSLDSLYHYRKQNTFGSTYWQQNNYYWYDRSNQPTLLAYQILKAAGKESELKTIRQWFFQQRGKYTASAWMNTYQTATILATILPEILAETSVSDFGKDQFKINGDSISQFPYQATYTANQPLLLEKKGVSPIFFTAYQRYFETQPKRKDSLFDITSTLYQEGKKVNKLEQGKRVKLKVNIEVKETAEYVMIEIPIPAACSYHSKPNGWQFPEVHREYFKEKTAIFCQKLEAGTYEFELDLEARFTGNYTLNPVRVEEMYFPVFDGNNEGKRVVVK